MKAANLLQRKIIDLVDHDYTYANILHFFGIPFYEAADKTLADICQEKNINIYPIIRQMECAVSSEAIEYPGEKYPIDIIIAYLKHVHGVFIRHKLPYIGELISGIALNHFDNPNVANDLKFVFPLFTKEFIAHIHEEEDTLFSHCLQLQSIVSKQQKVTTLHFHLNKFNINAFAEYHHEEDDVMQGIRLLTQNYRLTPYSTTYTKVIYQELQAFENMLMVHAKVENNILMPKAVELEQTARELLKTYSLLN